MFHFPLYFKVFSAATHDLRSFDVAAAAGKTPPDRIASAVPGTANHYQNRPKRHSKMNGDERRSVEQAHHPEPANQEPSLFRPLKERAGNRSE